MRNYEMTRLADDFQFSQGSLQDFVDCPRRFQLRYIEQVAWPAVEAEPALENERHLQQGAAFHRLIHQHLSGIPQERLSRTVSDEDLRGWWLNYLEGGTRGLPEQRYPEIVLSAPAGVHRLLAKFDLVAIEPGQRVVIVDWKTSRHRPHPRWLAERLQTRVYPYLLVQAGAQLNDGQSISPNQVEMIYWFANFPTDPERFVYDEAQCEAGGAYLEALIAEIRLQAQGDEPFPMTDDDKACRFCVYRSLCARGVQAGPMRQREKMPETAESLDFDFDFEQIAEIEW
jgi:CRISPR/Cas system-associated exonuclease Cas4 (RecB family)